MDNMTIAKEILSKALFVPQEQIDDDSDISGVKAMDSLAFEALVLEIEEWAGKDVDLVELMGVKTVRDLAALLEKYR